MKLIPSDILIVNNKLLRVLSNFHYYYYAATLMADVSDTQHDRSVREKTGGRESSHCTVLGSTRTLLWSTLCVLKVDRRLSQEELVFTSWFSFLLSVTTLQLGLSQRIYVLHPLHHYDGSGVGAPSGQGHGDRWMESLARGSHAREDPGLESRATWYLVPGPTVPPGTVLCVRTCVPSVFNPV